MSDFFDFFWKISIILAALGSLFASYNFFDYQQKIIKNLDKIDLTLHASSRRLEEAISNLDIEIRSQNSNIIDLKNDIAKSWREISDIYKCVKDKKEKR